MTAPGKVQSAPRLREATFEDFEQIAAVQARAGLVAPHSYEQWVHLWLHNPAYRELEDWPIGWVLESGGQVVGSMSNIPLAYELGGQRILAATGRGWAVDPEHRAYAFLLLEKLVNQQRIELYVNNSVSSTSSSGVDFFGCLPVPSGGWDEAGFWLTGYRTFAEAALRHKSLPMARAASYPLAVALYSRDLVRSSLTTHHPGVELQACSEFDNRFDRFWNELRWQKPGVLLAVRSREMLAWHFRYALAQRRAWVVAAVRGRRLVAYAIFDRKDKPDLGLRRMRLVDFQARPGEERLCRPLLAWGLETCRRERLHLLEDLGHTLERGARCGPLAPYRRKMDFSVFVYKTRVPALAERLQAPEVWEPSSYDGDASL